MTRRKGTRGQWCVRKPSDVWSASRSVQPVSAKKTEVQKKASERGQPKTKRVQAWKCHVPCADHQWNQVVREPEHDGHGHEEDHGGSVHREHSVEDLRRNKVVVRTHQLDANDGSF